MVVQVQELAQLYKQMARNVYGPMGKTVIRLIIF
jgi:hypothetical protein